MSLRASILLAVLLSAFGISAIVHAERFFWTRARVCDQGRIRAYQYDADKSLTTALIDLVNTVAQPEVITQTLQSAGSTIVRRKSFFGDRDRIEIGGLSASDISAQMRDTGVLTSSCSLFFNGETEQSLKGTNVTLRLRVFTGSSGGDRSQMTMIWETAQEVWIPTKQIKTVPIVLTNRATPPHNRRQVYPAGSFGQDTTVPLNADDYRGRPEEIFVSHFNEIHLIQFVIERHSDR